VYHIRIEGAAVILGVIAAYVMAPEFSWSRRAALAATATLCFVVTVAAWSSYFDHKWAEATTVVAEAGGHPYIWPRSARHQVWGSVFAGLGDFDATYGYSWKDQGSIPYLQEVLTQKYGETLPWWYGWNGKRARTREDYFDAAQLYYRHPLQTPHLLDVARDKVLHDVSHDPWWYVTILAKRVRRVLEETTPIQVYLTSRARFRIPFSGYLAIPIALLAIALRDWLAIRLLVFSLPLSLTAVAIYSGGHTPYYGVYHVVAAAIALGWIAAGAVRLYDERMGRQLGHKLGIYFAVCTAVRQPWAVFRNQCGWLAPGEFTLALRNGLMFRCRANTTDANEAVAVGLAREYPASLLMCLPPFATVIDLGGHIGAFAVLAVHLRSDITVYTYEPSSQNVRLLGENVMLNAAQARVVIRRAAASDRDGSVRLSLRGATDAFHVLPDAVQPAGDEHAFEDVNAQSLSSILRDIGAARIDLLKMDIEGSEYAVLESSPEAIAKCDTVMMEWHKDPAGAHTVDWLLRYFLQLGFEVDQPRANLIAATQLRRAAPVRARVSL